MKAVSPIASRAKIEAGTKLKIKEGFESRASLKRPVLKHVSGYDYYRSVSSAGSSNILSKFERGRDKARSDFSSKSAEAPTSCYGCGGSHRMDDCTKA